MQTREAWSQIDVQLKRRNDLIQNPVEAIKVCQVIRKEYTGKSDSN